LNLSKDKKALNFYEMSGNSYLSPGMECMQEMQEQFLVYCRDFHMVEGHFSQHKQSWRGQNALKILLTLNTHDISEAQCISITYYILNAKTQTHAKAHKL